MYIKFDWRTLWDHLGDLGPDGRELILEECVVKVSAKERSYSRHL
jgi:hypothetical protein